LSSPLLKNNFSSAVLYNPIVSSISGLSNIYYMPIHLNFTLTDINNNVFVFTQQSGLESNSIIYTLTYSFTLNGKTINNTNATLIYTIGSDATIANAYNISLNIYGLNTSNYIPPIQNLYLPTTLAVSSNVSSASIKSIATNQSKIDSIAVHTY